MKLMLTAAALASLGGCATLPPAAMAPETVKIARGPCFGFCPVYDVTLDRSGVASFTGIRHTAFLGTRSHPVDRATSTSLRAALARYRPAADGNFPCANAVTDQATYAVSWTGPSGARTLTFNSGCADPEARNLRTMLESVPASLGFAAEAQQVQRPGESRG